VAPGRPTSVGRRRSSPPKTVIEQFGWFLNQTDRLSRRRLMRSGLDTNLTITARGATATADWRRPDEEEFQAFLVDLRPFISEGEPVFIDRIYSLIEQHVTDPKLRAEARRSRKTLRDVEVGADLHLGDRSPAQIADAHVDGTFHVDPAAREQSAQPAGFFADLDRWFVHSYCAGVARRVAEATSIVRRALANGVVSETAITGEGA